MLVLNDDAEDGKVKGIVFVQRVRRVIDAFSELSHPMHGVLAFPV